MLLDVIYSVCFNICLLVVLAFMMTKMDFVQRLLLNEEGGSEEGRGESVWQRLWEKVLLGVIFGVFCIISDYIGIQVTGAAECPGDRCPVRRISWRSCLGLYHDSDCGGSPVSDLP